MSARRSMRRISVRNRSKPRSSGYSPLHEAHHTVSAPSAASARSPVRKISLTYSQNTYRMRMGSPEGETMVRIQLDMPDEQVEVLDRLMRDLNIRTRKDLFNNALTLFEWAVKEKRAGRAIASINEADGKFREILMPVLEGPQASVPLGKTSRMSEFANTAVKRR